MTTGEKRAKGVRVPRERASERETYRGGEVLVEERQRERGERKEKTGRWEALKGRERGTGFNGES
jgi:hypothetical protein